jgi:hypothetical protein
MTQPGVTSEDLLDLARLTLRDPASAGQRIMALKLSRDVLWTGLALVAAANTIILSISAMILPPSGLPAFFNSPLAMFVILAGVLVVTVHGIYWTGQALGGQGDLGDLLAMLVWLQVLRVGVQLVVTLLIFAAPTLSLMVSLIAAVWALWILLHFIAAAFRFPSLGKAAGVLLVATIGLVLGLGMLMSLIGLSIMGGTPSV